MEPGMYLVIVVAVAGLLALPLYKAGQKHAQEEFGAWESVHMEVRKMKERESKQKREEAQRIAREIVDEMERRQIERTTVHTVKNH